MNKIKDLPLLERPREKALRYGVDTLSNIELLSIVISCGTKGYSAIDISTSLLSQSGGLNFVAKIPFNELIRYPGLSTTSAIKLMSVFEIFKRLESHDDIEIKTDIDSDMLYKKFKKKMVSLEQENLILVILNKRHQIIREITLYKGTDNNINFSFRDVFKNVISYNGYSYYIIHNHPGGKTKPSNADIILTQRLFVESERVGVPLEDHLIISSKGYYSFKKQFFPENNIFLNSLLNENEK